MPPAPAGESLEMTHSIVVASYILILIGVAVHKSRTVRSADDFMVAGRSVPVYMLVATLVCTWIGSGSLFGTAGLTFRTGISELWFSAGMEPVEHRFNCRRANGKSSERALRPAVTTLPSSNFCGINGIALYGA